MNRNALAGQARRLPYFWVHGKGCKASTFSLTFNQALSTFQRTIKLNQIIFTRHRIYTIRRKNFVSGKQKMQFLRFFFKPQTRCDGATARQVNTDGHSAAKPQPKKIEGRRWRMEDRKNARAQKSSQNYTI
jgi:hypothetical protein